GPAPADGLPGGGTRPRSRALEFRRKYRTCWRSVRPTAFGSSAPPTTTFRRLMRLGPTEVSPRPRAAVLRRGGVRWYLSPARSNAPVLRFRRAERRRTCGPTPARHFCECSDFRYRRMRFPRPGGGEPGPDWFPGRPDGQATQN